MARRTCRTHHMQHHGFVPIRHVSELSILPLQHSQDASMRVDLVTAHQPLLHTNLVGLTPAKDSMKQAVHHNVPTTHLSQGQCANVHTVHDDASARQPDHPEQRHQQGGLAAACASNNANLQAKRGATCTAVFTVSKAHARKLSSWLNFQIAYLQRGRHQVMGSAPALQKHVLIRSDSGVQPPHSLRTFSQLCTWKLTCLKAKGPPGK